MLKGLRYVVLLQRQFCSAFDSNEIRRQEIACGKIACQEVVTRLDVVGEDLGTHQIMRTLLISKLKMPSGKVETRKGVYYTALPTLKHTALIYCPTSPPKGKGTGEYGR
jgi:hypothetical protein